MKVTVLTLPVLLALGACQSKPAQPQPTDGVWLAWNTPDGEVHAEKVRNLSPGEAAGPTTTTIIAGTGRAGRASVDSPPEIEPGKFVSLDWAGTGPMSGEVLEVRGHWVKLRFTIEQKGPDPNTAIAASTEAWVNFDRLTYYMAPRLPERKS